MANHHARPQPAQNPDRLLKILVPAAVVFVFAASLGIEHYRFDRPWPSVTARVLATRIVTLGAQDGYYRGVILYRAEAHVIYQLNGKQMERWLPASGMHSDRVYLAFWLSQKKSKTCIVHWNPNNPSDV